MSWRQDRPRGGWCCSPTASGVISTCGAGGAAARRAFRVVAFDFIGSGRSDRSAWDVRATRRWTVTPRTWRSCAGSWTCVRWVRRTLGQRHDWRARGATRATAVRRAGAREPRRRATSTTATTAAGSARRRSRSCSSRWQQLPGLAASMAPVIMGNPERPELGEELTKLLPDGPASRPGVRPRHLPVRQPRRPGEGRGPDAGAAVRTGRDRPTRGGGVRAGAHTGERAGHARRDRALSPAQRAAGTAEQTIAFGSSG